MVLFWFFGRLFIFKKRRGGIVVVGIERRDDENDSTAV